MSTESVVYLVGAGPGDPGLITVAGAEALRRADVVVYDYLANKRLLELAPPEAERIYVGKSGDGHTMGQDEINQLLVEKANAKDERRKTKDEGAARVIVRLKGGDPYVFGRGGEEAEFLRARGVRFVVVPGVTSGIAAAAYAGIPVTHRDFTSTMTLVTGHEKDESQKTQDQKGGVDYAALAKLGGTIVFYMGVKSLPQITRRLIDAGMNPATPAAVVRWGTLGEQRAVSGTVGTIAGIVEQAGIKSPAITVVGEVVKLRETLNWFEERPLFGQRILVTRTRQQASDLSTRLQELGAMVMEAPTIELAAPADFNRVDRAIGEMKMGAFDWTVFTSANGVRAAWERIRNTGMDARAFKCKVAAIGPATAEALAAIGIQPDLVPERAISEALAQAMRQQAELRGARMLMLRADIARAALREELEIAGALVEDVEIYQTRRVEKLPQEVTEAIGAGALDWVTFTSASTAENLWTLLSAELREKVKEIKMASIGPVTSAAMEKLGWKPHVEAKVHDVGGVVEAVRSDGK